MITLTVITLSGAYFTNKYYQTLNLNTLYLKHITKQFNKWVKKDFSMYSSCGVGFSLLGTGYSSLLITTSRLHCKSKRFLRHCRDPTVGPPPFFLLSLAKKGYFQPFLLIVVTLFPLICIVVCTFTFFGTKYITNILKHFLFIQSQV